MSILGGVASFCSSLLFNSLSKCSTYDFVSESLLGYVVSPSELIKIASSSALLISNSSGGSLWTFLPTCLSRAEEAGHWCEQGLDSEVIDSWHTQLTINDGLHNRVGGDLRIRKLEVNVVNHGYKGWSAKTIYD